MRGKGTYAILRELHTWETDPSALAACEKLVQVREGNWDFLPTSGVSESGLVVAPLQVLTL